MEKRLKNIQAFKQHSSELNISAVIKRLDTDDSEITFGDYFLEVGEYNFIHILIEDDSSDYEDYTLPNGIEVVPLNESDFE